MYLNTVLTWDFTGYESVFDFIFIVSNIAARNATTSSFATILSSAREVESSEQHTNALVKKGKKPNKVLLSTAGGRRY